MLKFIISVLLVMVCLQVIQAQQLVIVNRRHPHKKYTFKEGESIKLKRKDTGEIIRGSWRYDREDTIVVASQLIGLRAIKWINISKKEKGIWLLRKGQDMFILVGLGLLTVSQINRVMQPEKFTVADKVYANSARMVAGGLVCRGLDRTLRPRKVRPGRNFGMYTRKNT